MSTVLLPSEQARLAAPGSRYSLPGKVADSKIFFGLKRGSPFFQFSSGDRVAVDESRLSQTEVVALLKRYGASSSDLQKAISAFMQGEDPGDQGLRGIRGGKRAGFSEGPKGEKEFDAWFKGQPKDFQEDWKSNTDKYKDKFEESMSSIREEACGGSDAYIMEEAMYAQGENVPLSDLPEELQENVRNPPPGVEKLKKKMEEESMMYKTDMLPVEMARMRAAAGGMYGYTKATQNDVEVLVRRARKKASAIARAIYTKDERVGTFLQVHASRAKSASARLLLAALKDLGPKIAGGKVARGKAGPLGLYGFPSKIARMGLIACVDLRGFCGEASYELHNRRQARHERITGFLKEHGKQARCAYSRMLLGCYPDAPKVAGDLSKLPPALREQAEKKIKEKKDKEESKKDKSKKKADFDPDQIGDLESGALVQDADESYMSENFTEQEGDELSDKQEAGTLNNGQADKGPGKVARPDTVNAWLEWKVD